MIALAAKEDPSKFYLFDHTATEDSSSTVALGAESSKGSKKPLAKTTSKNEESAESTCTYVCLYTNVCRACNSSCPSPDKIQTKLSPNSNTFPDQLPNVRTIFKCCCEHWYVHMYVCACIYMYMYMGVDIRYIHTFVLMQANVIQYMNDMIYVHTCTCSCM